ncbi:unnamed protein product [Protopolystoma xenopodis]|uniref:K Homology domain-containing protein n=1 Tax=Protopolystoma xenopodis TaxID=117903 RepID=A0A3S5C9L1_9PLAT|nr:unnamed protein product [Protopolystoma xenopodis]
MGFQVLSCEQLKKNLDYNDFVHPILIGAGQSALHRVQSRFNVTIEFPSRLAKGAAGNTVIVMGEQSNVDEACDYLINRANDLVSLSFSAEYTKMDTCISETN